MLWRVSACVLSIAFLMIGANVFGHGAFESEIISDKSGRYTIEVSFVQFYTDATKVDLTVTDSSEHPEFLIFRSDVMMRYPISLSVPKRSADLKTGWRYSLRQAFIPSTVQFSKPSSTEHEATIALYFYPLIKAGPNEIIPSAPETDEVWLSFEDFPPLRITRVSPIDPSLPFISPLEFYFAENISRGWAFVFVLLGLAGSAVSGTFLYQFIKKQKRLKGLMLEPLRKNPFEGQAKSAKENVNVDAEMPSRWDEDEVAIRMRNLYPRPAVLSVWVEGLVARFVAGQDERTAKKRTTFLQAKLEEAKAAKELRSTLDELKLLNLTYEINKLKLETEHASLQTKKSNQREIANLEHQRDMLKLQVEIARSKKEIRDFETTYTPPRQPSAEELRQEKRQEIEKEIKSLEQEAREIKGNSSLGEETKRRRLNIVSKRLEELYEQLEKSYR